MPLVVEDEVRLEVVLVVVVATAMVIESEEDLYEDGSQLAGTVRTHRLSHRQSRRNTTEMTLTDGVPRQLLRGMGKAVAQRK